MPQDKKRKAALITGAAKRIGAAIALDLARQGYDIALHYHTSVQAAQRTQKKIQREGGTCRVFTADLSDNRQMTQLIPQVKKYFPRLCLLVNNASIYKSNRISDIDTDLYDLVMDTNLKAPCILTSLFGRHCRKGQVINMLDTHITRNKTGYFYYLLSKKALKEFTQMAALALAPGICVNAVAPGAIIPPASKNQNDLKKLVPSIPLKKTGKTDDILKAVRYLTKNTFYSGQILYIDGGVHLT